MTILGIDPGNVRAGYGFIEKEGSRLTFLEGGLIKIPQGADPGVQLLALEKDLDRLIRKMKPELVGLEKIFITKNKKTGVFVAQARGIIMKVVADHKLKLVELSPPSIKLAVTGYGRADKKAVAKMVGMLLGMKTAGLIDDETDAIATAIAVSNR
jgi:crossover junction endodeoxyribonuclease RuvC